MNMTSISVTPTDDTRIPERDSGLEINAIEGGFMAYQPEKNRVHYLNHTSLLVLELCTGHNSVSKIAEYVQEAFGLDEIPMAEISEIISQMQSEMLVTLA